MSIPDTLSAFARALFGAPKKRKIAALGSCPACNGIIFHDRWCPLIGNEWKRKTLCQICEKKEAKP